MFTHDKQHLHLKLELWLGIFVMLLLSGCGGCGGCGGDLDEEYQTTPAQRSCEAATAFRSVGLGVSFQVDLATSSADLTLTTDACVSARSTVGSDFFYKAIIPPKHQLSVDIFSYREAVGSVYLFTDCDDAAGTCIAGAEGDAEDPRTQLRHINTTQETQTLIIAIDSTSDEGAIHGSIQVNAIECIPGEQRCDEDGKTLQRCGQETTYERYACDGACTDGRCETPSGDSCFDAIALEGASGSVSGDWNNSNNYFDISDQSSGQCYIRNKNLIGRERFYSVALEAGELLSATLMTSVSRASLLIVEDCNDPATCVESSLTPPPTTLQYYAQQARTVYLIVDTEETRNLDDYELSWKISAGDVCSPGQTRCLDANTATYCNPRGTAESSYSCAQGCSFRGCNITLAEHDSCAVVAASAQDIGQGVSISVKLKDFNDDINEQLGCLNNKSGRGSDLFYKVNLEPDEIVEVHVQGAGFSEPLIYAFTDCDEVNKTCGVGAWSDNADTASLFYQNKTGAAQTLIIAIDSNNAFTTGIVQAQLHKQKPECEPNSSICDQDTLLTCNAQRRYVPYQCKGGCTNGHCADAKGDVCLDAIALVGDGGVVEADWRDGTNSFSLDRGYTGQCYIDYNPFTPRGAEDFYRVDLQAGELLTVSLSSDNVSESLFILESCVDALACVQNGSYTNELRYYAHQAISLYLVADQSDDELKGNYKLSWNITRGNVCGPSQTRCIDAMTAGKCNADGSAETPIICANGCDFTGCSPDIATQDSCESVAAGMVSVTGSLSTQAYMEDFSPTLTLGPSQACPITIEENSADFFYKVELKADDRLRVRANTNGDFTPMLYLFTDCGDASGTCLAHNTRETNLEYINTTGAPQTLLLSVVSLNKSGEGIIQVEIDISAPQCTPGAVQCHANGTSLLECDHLGIFVPIACNGGCSEGACINPSGDYCVDAIALPGTSGSISGTINEQPTNSYQLGVGYSGACYLDTTSSINTSQETFYRVDLQAGEELVANLSASSTSTQLFLMTDCADPKSCVATGPTSGSTTLRYLATGAQTVFIAVDSSSTSRTPSYTLDWLISSSVCAAGTTTCIDANTVSYCSQTGQASAAATCANGCFQGGCQAQAALQDVCADVLAAATDVGAGIAIYALHEDFTNSVNFTSANSCAGGTTPGRDLFYKVTLAADEVVRVSAQGYSSNNPIVYVIEDCSLSAASCLAGAREQGSTDLASVSYANTTGATKVVLVGVDSSTSSPIGPIKATIERLAPECGPGTSVCANGVELLACSPQGLYERSWCDGGCADGACIAP